MARDRAVGRYAAVGPRKCEGKSIAARLSSHGEQNVTEM